MKIWSKIESALSEPNSPGSISWGRCASSFLILVTLFWFTYCVLKRIHSMDELVALLRQFKDAIEADLMPYATNRLTTMVQGFSGNPINPSGPAVQAQNQNNNLGIRP